MNNNKLKNTSVNAQMPASPYSSIKIDEYLAELAVSNPVDRRASLCSILKRNNFDYTVQHADPSVEYPNGIENYLIQIGPNELPHILLCAHYDAFPGSCGANDNAAAVCILIELAKELKKQTEYCVEIAFFDGEESKHSGSRLYVNELDVNRLSAVVNLDICGYGDTITIYNHGSNHKASIRNFCDKVLLARHNAQLVKYLPESDDITFHTTHLPTLNIAIMPKWDAKNLKVLASYNENILGKPPEFELILGQMEVITTMHGGFHDKVSIVQPAAMLQVYEYLFDSITSPISDKKRFHLF